MYPCITRRHDNISYRPFFRGICCSFQVQMVPWMVAALRFAGKISCANTPMLSWYKPCRPIDFLKSTGDNRGKASSYFQLPGT